MSATGVVLLLGARVAAWNPEILEECARRRLEVVGIDEAAATFDGRAQAAAHGARSVVVERADVGSVLAALAALEVSELVAVIALCEPWVVPAAVLADVFAVAGTGVFAATVARDKALQRMVLPGGPSWSFVEGDELDAWGRFPVVIKPVDGSAGRGVIRLDGPADRSKVDVVAGATWLAEDAVSGRELALDSYVLDGEILTTVAVAKEIDTGDGRRFVEVAHTVGADVPEDVAEPVAVLNRDVVTSLRLVTGVVHAEYLVEDGRAWLVEVNLRCAGGSIPLLYRLAGVGGAFVAALDLALGRRPILRTPTRTARQRYVTGSDGTFVDCRVPEGVPVTWLGEGGKPLSVAYAPSERAVLHGVMVIKNRGATIRAPQDNDDRVAAAVMSAPTAATLEALDAALLRDLVPQVGPSPRVR